MILPDSNIHQKLASLIIQKDLGTRDNPVFRHTIIVIRGK